MNALQMVDYLKRKWRFLLVAVILLALNFLVWGIAFGLFEKEKRQPNPVGGINSIRRIFS